MCQPLSHPALVFGPTLPISPGHFFFTFLNVASSLFPALQFVLNLKRGFKSSSALNSVVNLPFS